MWRIYSNPDPHGFHAFKSYPNATKAFLISNKILLPQPTNVEISNLEKVSIKGD
jgi:hypothetical protein